MLGKDVLQQHHEVSGLHGDAGSSQLAPLMGRCIVAWRLYRRAEAGIGAPPGESSGCQVVYESHEV